MILDMIHSLFLIDNVRAECEGGTMVLLTPADDIPMSICP